MLLKQIKVTHFGPFSFPNVIEIDQEVTVFTGANDVGKSSALTLIQKMCDGNAVGESEVNSYRSYDSNQPWMNDPDICINAVFGKSANLSEYVGGSNLEFVEEIELEIRLAPNQDRSPRIVGVKTNGGSATVNEFKKFPRAFFLPSMNEIKSNIDIRGVNENEAKLLGKAFGANFAAKLSVLSGVGLSREISRGSERLNDALKLIMPSSMRYSVQFEKLNDNPLQLAIILRDQYDGDTPLQYRGAGVRKIINLLFSILAENFSSTQNLLLLDEPETSLHADAQHVLRAFLEELAKMPTVQVIYATHSPAMINSTRSNGLRLFKRENKDGKATSLVSNHPIGDNFSPVRLSLGVTPADSLLYAPISLIVEGKTELRALPFLLRRLQKSNVPGFGQVDQLLAQIHMIDGQGDKFDKWCGMAQSQGSKAIVFVDGDKAQRVKVLKDKFPQVPIVELPLNTEFEDIVKADAYLEALSKLYGAEINAESYNKWEQDHREYSKRLFSKRIQRWMDDEFPEVDYNKDDVMSYIVDHADLSDITNVKLLELVKAMERLLAEDNAQ